MKLEAFIAEQTCDLKDDEKEEEFCSAGGDDENDSVEADLVNTLDFLEQALMMMEEILIQKGKIKKIPSGFQDLMEECSEHLEQWQGYSPRDRAEKYYNQK